MKGREFSREAKGTTMLFSFEEGDAKGSINQRRAQRPRRVVDLDKFSQVLRGSASDDLVAEASYFGNGSNVRLLDDGPLVLSRKIV